MDPEEKQLLRYQRQRQKEFSRKSIFNLSDDEGEGDGHPRGMHAFIRATPGVWMHSYVHAQSWLLQTHNCMHTHTHALTHIHMHSYTLALTAV